jgi:hypothetical protein
MIGIRPRRVTKPGTHFCMLDSQSLKYRAEISAKEKEGMYVLTFMNYSNASTLWLFDIAVLKFSKVKRN